MKFRYIIVDEFFSVKIFDPGNVTMGRQLARWLSHYDNMVDLVVEILTHSRRAGVHVNSAPLYSRTDD